MIHSLSTLPVGTPMAQALGAKTVKGVGESAMLALFGEALVAQLKVSADSPSGGTEVLPGVLPDPALTGAPGKGLVGAEQAGDEVVEGGKPADILASGEVVDPAQLSGLLLSVPGLPPGSSNPVVSTGSLDETALEAPPRGGLEGLGKSGRASAGMKNLPVTPAGIAVNAQAIQTDAAQTVPDGLPLKAEFSSGWDMKTLAPAIETGASMTLRPGIGVPAEGALPTSQPGTFSVLSNQGDALGVSPAARQVAQLATPFAHAQWQSDLGEKVVWLAGRQGQMAELSLNPPSLGGIEVRLNLSGQEAGAHFFSANPAVREAIEAALPRLREMMAEAGLSLGQTTVSSEPFRDREAHAQTAQTGSGEDETTGDFLPAGEAIWRRGHPGRVDLYV